MNSKAARALHAGEQAGLSLKVLKRIWHDCTRSQRPAFAHRLLGHAARLSEAPRIWMKSGPSSPMPYLVEPTETGYLIHFPTASRRADGRPYLPLGVHAFAELLDATEILFDAVDQPELFAQIELFRQQLADAHAHEARRLAAKGAKGTCATAGAL